jgi:hypothetical protein
MLDGVRFAGLDQLLLALDRIASAWEEDVELGRCAFLVHRAVADFETAIESALSGYHAVCSDAMRDVMEIELLLLDFSVAPERLGAWLSSDRTTRLRTFSPRSLRERIIGSGLHEVIGTRRVGSDYRAHSEALHVTPYSPPFAFMRKGFQPAEDFVSLDSSFIEIFEHARRLGNALLLCANRLTPDSRAELACHGPLPDFELAYERTQEFFTEFFGALQEAFPDTERFGIENGSAGSSS